MNQISGRVVRLFHECIYEVPAYSVLNSVPHTYSIKSNGTEQLYVWLHVAHHAPGKPQLLPASDTPRVAESQVTDFDVVT